MLLPNGAFVAVTDGEKLSLFHNHGHDDKPALRSVETGKIDTHNHSSGGRHHTGSANPDHGQSDEDAFAAGAAAFLDAEVSAGRIKQLVLVAAPRTLGEMRKKLSKETSAAILGEINKDLTNQSAEQILKSIENA